MIAEVEFHHKLLTEPSEIVGGNPKPSRVVLDATKVFAVTYAPQHKCTVVMSTGGNHVPILGTVEEALLKLKEAEEKVFNNAGGPARNEGEVNE